MKFACIALLCLAFASTVSAQMPVAPSVADALALAPNNTLSTLKAALDAAGLTQALRNESLVATIFAPTNDAFAEAIAALNTTATALLANKALLTDILSYHVVPGVAATSDMLKDGQVLPTLLGQTLTVSLMGGNVTIIADGSEAMVIPEGANILAGKSVVHVIDAVLVPKL